MKTKLLKDLTRTQLVKLLKKNMPHVGFNKKTTLQSLRDKINLLGGNFAMVTFDKDWKIV